MLLLQFGEETLDVCIFADVYLMGGDAEIVATGRQ
jgi:hypothetical protein